MNKKLAEQVQKETVSWYLYWIKQTRQRISYFTGLLKRMPNSSNIIYDILEDDQKELQLLMQELITYKRGIK